MRRNSRKSFYGFVMVMVAFVATFALLVVLSLTHNSRVARATDATLDEEEARAAAKAERYQAGEVVVTTKGNAYMVLDTLSGHVAFTDGVATFKELPGKPKAVYNPRHRPYYELATKLESKH